jgi:hypothetical protein
MSHTVEKLIWMATLVLVVLVALLGITVVNLGGRVPALKPLGNGSRTATEWPTPAQVGGWFDLASLTRLTSQTNGINPFFTRHFQPPPPPTTRPAELTYLGYFQGGTRAPRALILLDQATLPFNQGSVVVADHRVASIARRTLVLTNTAGATNVLEFNLKKVLIVPIK